MHELSIAMGIVDAAADEAHRRRVKVNAVHLRLGALSGVVKDALLSSYELACQDTPLAGSRLVVEDVPVAVLCPQCKEKRVRASFASILRLSGMRHTHHEYRARQGTRSFRSGSGGMSQPCHVEVWEKTSSRRQPDPTGRMRTTTIESVPPGMRV